VTGVSWRSGLAALRVLGTSGQGTSASVAAGIAFAGREGVPIVNASLGGPSRSRAIEDAIASAPRTLFVIAAGNDGVDNDASPHYPCAIPLPNIVCVAATDASDQLASFSNYGATSVDLGAPGVGIESTVPTWETTPVYDFASLDMADWRTGGENAHTGAPAAHWGPDTFGGLPTLGSDPGGPAPVRGDDSWAALTKPLPIAGRRGCSVSVDVHRELMTDRDALWIEFSPDQLTWLPARQITTTSPAPDLLGRFAAGLPDGAPPIYVRFRLLKDSPDAQETRVWLSNLALRCVGPEAPGGGSYAFFNGTSMATPEVSGVAALLMAKNPNLSVAQLRAALLDTVDPIPALAGKVVTGGRVDAARALASVPAPSPSSTGTPTSPPAGSGGAGPVVGPDASASAPLSVQLGRIASSRLRLAALRRVGLRVPVSCSGACAVSAQLTLGAGTARRLHVARTIASGRATLASAGDAPVLLRLGSAAKRRLEGAHALHATLRLVATGDAGSARAKKVVRLT
jgi:thermitase